MKTNEELARLNAEAALRALARGDIRAARNLLGTARDDAAKALQERKGKKG